MAPRQETPGAYGGKPIVTSTPPDTSATRDAQPSSRPRTEIARAVIDALNAHDPEGIVARMHPDIVDDFVAVERFTSVEQVRAFFAETFATIPDLALTIEATHEVGDVVTVQWSASGTFNGHGTFQGIKPTGRPVAWRGCDVMEFEGDLLRRNAVYYDGLTFARQIGLLPRKGSGGDRGLLGLFNTVTRMKRLLPRR